MKTERRQELRSNDLARILDDSREFLRAWGSYLVGGIVIVVVLVAFVAYRSRAAGQDLRDSWDRLREARQKSFLTQSGEKRTDAEINSGFESLDQLAEGVTDGDLLFEVLVTQAQVAVQLSRMGPGGTDSGYLDRAENAYVKLRDRLAANPLAVATALDGLVAVEADRFVADSDPAHKENARRDLERLRDDSRFANTPFQRAALDRLNRLDEVFRPVELVAAQPPVIRPVEEGPPVTLVRPPDPSSAPVPVTATMNTPGVLDIGKSPASASEEETGEAEEEDPEGATPATDDGSVDSEADG
ncbi:MAG: hypothetical protein GY842_05890 [bacterium]|nr:hypothetical protein [bacterium]